jgi:hypothetical protein
MYAWGVAEGVRFIRARGGADPLGEVDEVGPTSAAPKRDQTARPE